MRARVTTIGLHLINNGVALMLRSVSSQDEQTNDNWTIIQIFRMAKKFVLIGCMQAERRRAECQLYIHYCSLHSAFNQQLAYFTDSICKQCQNLIYITRKTSCFNVKRTNMPKNKTYPFLFDALDIYVYVTSVKRL